MQSEWRTSAKRWVMPRSTPFPIPSHPQPPMSRLLAARACASVLSRRGQFGTHSFAFCSFRRLYRAQEMSAERVDDDACPNRAWQTIVTFRNVFKSVHHCEGGNENRTDIELSMSKHFTLNVSIRSKTNSKSDALLRKRIIIVLDDCNQISCMQIISDLVCVLTGRI